ncbi:uncharacterized protein SPPG_05240 [Spizellomyces punctatus DAOM BR117]|uniref:WD40 repeat-like protein n=1 Tax=Spizellomyces punctatus (strain DAOM BR117) TaxID=645134 RepID=A0A0L0HFG4_SPIPD|nr:uncharacterized protein SPPG_05240 [Spizellomyces punctatus DAOM BR117]KNC99867.1 hypothetical protein SPPG_05240 [Spizellomyces punctatus DAOM BR117]|eukprot:XP_016607907.1 hypothetical protein SPPG_05240 [Spizellomyces punctatus DAOM BR117]
MVALKGRIALTASREGGRETSIDDGDSSNTHSSDPPSLEAFATSGESTQSLDEILDETQLVGLLIQPWRTIKRQIASIVARSPHFSSSPSSSQFGLAGTQSLVKSGTFRSASPSSNPTPVLPTTIPHGFQPARVLPHHRPTVKSAIYISSPHNDRIASLDSHNVNIWRGSTRIAQIANGGEKGTAKTSVAGLSRWLYVAKWKVVVIATLHLELKILDTNFEELAAVSSVKPVLSLEFCDDTDELIAGGVGNIRIWKFKRIADGSRLAYGFDTPRLAIEDLGVEDWVSHTIYQKPSNRIYAALGNRIHIYDYESGERLDVLRDMHELSITAMALYEPLGTLITASRDSTIKVWNRQNNLIHELHDHSHAVTGLAIIPPPPARNGRSLEALAATPFFLSCSLDGTIRMWNADVGVCTYCLQTPSECLGIQWIKQDKETFLHYAKDRICLWNLNRFYTTFAYIRSQATQLHRSEHPSLPARILSIAEDGSLRLLSPVTGAVLAMGFPVMSDIATLDAVYDVTQNRAWLLSENGTIAVYGTNTNPCAIIGEWKVASYKPVVANKTRIMCMAALSPWPPVPYYSGAALPPTVYALLGGTDTGQIVVVDIRQEGKQSIVAQAHAAEITAILYDVEKRKLFTSGKDSIIRIWSISVPADTPLSILTNSTPESLTEYFSDSPLVVTLNSIAAISIPSGPVKQMAWNSRKEVMACAVGGRIFCLECDGKQIGIKKPHPIDDDHTNDVTKIASCEAIRIFASASTDGVVKIWDAVDNALIRELQFAEPITTLTFANQRGDLLISLPEQIVVVRVQDYLPVPYLCVLLDHGNWPDDPVEDPTMFDSSLDFWELYRANGGDGAVRWHVDENLKNDGPDPTSLALEELEKRREEKRIEEKPAVTVTRSYSRSSHSYELITLNDPSGHRDFSPVSFFPPSTLPMDTLTEEDVDLSTEIVAFPQAITAHRLSVSAPTSSSLQSIECIAGKFRYKRRLSMRRGSLGGRRVSTADFPGRGKGLWDDEDEEGEMEVDGGEQSLHQPGELVQEVEGGGMLTRPKAIKHDEPRRSVVKSDEPRRSVVRPDEPRRFSVARSDEQRRVSVVGGEDGVKRTGGAIWEAGLEPPSQLGPNYPDGKGPGLGRRKGRVLELRTGERVTPSPRTRHSPRALSRKGRKSTLAPPPRQQTPEAPSRQINIRNRMERLGVLPNSVMAGQTKPALEQKRLVQEQERREKDKEMVSKARAIIERRRAQLAAERAARGSVDDTTMPVEIEPDPTAKSVHAGRTRVEESESPEAARIRQEALEAAAAWRIRALHTEEAAKAEALGRAKTAAAEAARKSAIEAAEAANQAKMEAAVEQAAAQRAQELFERALAAATPKKILRSGSVAIGQIIQITPGKVGVTETNFGASKPIPIHIIGGKPSQKRGNAQKLPEVQDSPKSVTRKKKQPLQNVLTQTPKSGLASENKRRSPVPHQQPAPAEKHRERHGRTPKKPNEVWEESEIVPELQAIMDKFWFPGLGDKDVTLQNILGALFKVLKTGYWSEKCEASDSLLYLYQTFQDDFRNPVQDFILPQLESFNDRDWQLRSRMCSNLVKYGVYNPYLIQALIARLVDPIEDVR